MAKNIIICNMTKNIQISAVIIAAISLMFAISPFSPFRHKPSKVNTSLHAHNNEKKNPSHVINPWQNISFSRKSNETARPDIDDVISERISRVDVQAVQETAGEFELPYASEEERADVLKRLRAGENEFNQMISNIEDNIKNAIKDGSRSLEELEEADEALAEMKRGKEFIKNRIKMVENENLE